MEAYRRLAIRAGSLVSIVLLWYFVLYRPQSQTSKEARVQVDRLGKEIQAITATEQKLEMLRRRLAIVDSSIERLESKVYPKQRLPEILQEMEIRGRQFDLRFKSIFPDYAIMFTEDSSEVSPAGLMRVPVHFIIEGGYISLGRYLETLPEMPWAVTVGGLDVRLWRDSYPRLMIDLLGYIYVYDETKGGRDRFRLGQSKRDTGESGREKGPVAGLPDSSNLRGKG
jgi:Tfp pilus assembly protein PilO